MSANRYADDLELDLQAYAHDNEKVETAILSLESLTETQDLMADGDKGLDETAYKLVQHSVESFLRMGRIGYASNKVMPDLQAYAPHDLSQVALEGFGEGVKNVFMSIINAIKKAFQWVWGLIKRIFGRNKDREEKTAELKQKAEEVKEKVESLTDEEKKTAPYQRGADGFFVKVDLSKPEILKPICTHEGIMNGTYLAKIGSELIKVFSAQAEMNKSAKESIIGDSQSSKPMPIAFPETHDGKILAATRGKNGNMKVYASEEFGDNTFVTIQMPEPPKYGDKEDDVMKANLKWVDELRIAKTKVEGVVNYAKFAVLDGDFANPDKLIENIQFLNMQIEKVTEKIEQYQRDKEAFVKAVEAKIKQHGANLFSSKDKKAERDFMMYDLKFFQKTMDQPGLMYFGLVDQVVNGFINLSTYVLHFNSTNGNHVELKKHGH
uniref:PhiKZ-like internal head family protein n=1 Tax=Burkholderia phage vB_BgluM-SURPRISE13 TaxID=3159457 RepID=A0AAU7PEY1_9VIRU